MPGGEGLYRGITTNIFPPPNPNTDSKKDILMNAVFTVCIYISIRFLRFPPAAADIFSHIPQGAPAC